MNFLSISWSVNHLHAAAETFKSAWDGFWRNKMLSVLFSLIKYISETRLTGVFMCLAAELKFSLVLKVSLNGEMWPHRVPERAVVLHWMTTMGEKRFVPALWVIMRQNSTSLAAKLSEKWHVSFVGVVLCEWSVTNTAKVWESGGDGDRSNNWSNFEASTMWWLVWKPPLSVA